MRYRTSHANLRRQLKMIFRKATRRIAWRCPHQSWRGRCDFVNRGWRYDCENCGAPPPPEVQDMYRAINAKYHPFG